MSSFFGGYHDDNIYFNTPSAFVPNMHDHNQLEALRRMDIILVAGRDDPNIENNRALSRALWDKGVPHAFRITGDVPARALALTTPGGLLGLYDEVGIAASERRLPNGDGRPLPEEIARWGEIGPRYGLEVVGPPIPV